MCPIAREDSPSPGIEEWLVLEQAGDRLDHVDRGIPFDRRALPWSRIRLRAEMQASRRAPGIERGITPAPPCRAIPQWFPVVSCMARAR